MRGGRVKRKTAHSLRVTCVSPLFIGGVEEKLIRERSGGVTKTKTPKFTVKFDLKLGGKDRT